MLHRVFNSICCKYSLSVRLLALLLLVSSVASACSTDPAGSEEEDLPLERETNNPKADTTAARRTNKQPATFDLLGNPFVASRTQSNSLSTYYDRINTDFTIDASAVENIHQPEITDTIYTIRFGNSVVEFYAPSQTGELLLQVADIRNSNITLRNNLRVGMSQAELMGKLRPHHLRVQQTPTEIVASNLEGAPNALRFYLKNGKVSRIRYEGYID
jgi:hypothetical protein